MAGFSVSRTPIRNNNKDGSTTWSIRVRYEGEVKHRSETYPTRDAALSRAQEIRQQYENGTLTADEWRRKTTYEDWILDWWPRRVRRLEAASRTSYAREYNKVIRPYFREATMHTLVTDRDLVRRFYEHIRATHTPSRQDKIHTALSASFTGAVKEDRIDRNPVALMEIDEPGPNKRDRKAIAPELAVAIWRELGNDHRNGKLVDPIARLRSQVFFSIMLGTGTRPSEAYALQWSDIHETTIIVDKAMKADGKVGKTKTGKRKVVDRRTTVLPDWLKADLDLLAKTTGSTRERDEWIFLHHTGEGPWKQHNYEWWRAKTWVPAIERVVAKNKDWAFWLDVAPYSAGRATHCSLALAAGENPSDVARRVGNSTQTLHDHYDHPIELGRQVTRRTTGNALVGAARRRAKLKLVRVT